MTAAAAIESGLYESDDDVPAGAIYDVPQTSSDIGNDGRSACDPDEIPFTTAMANSCNTTFARMANDVGAEAMLEQAEAFGFNSDYLEDLPQAQSDFPEDPNEPETAQTGIGQFEVSATPLQMAMVAAGIANDGVVMRPYLVNKVQSADYQDLEQTDPSELSQAVSSSTAQQLTDLLVATVEEGTATPAAIPGVSVAGKTGTAQSGIDSVPPYAWFVSFAPADNPAGGGRDHDRVGARHRSRRDRRRGARRADRQGRDGSSVAMTDNSSGSGAGERFVDDANRYRLDSRIATGGMGEVWRATDTALGR